MVEILKMADSEVSELIHKLSLSNGDFAGIAMQTPIFLSQDNSEVLSNEIKKYYEYDFDNCKVVWINPLVEDEDLKTLSCARIFAFGKKDRYELLATARHFSGLVSFLTHFNVIIEVEKIMGNINEPPLKVLTISQGRFILDKYVYLSQGYPIGEILDVACHPKHPLEQKAILSLAHLRQAAQSFSVYWEYLCYWKVLEILYGRIIRGSGPLKTYIDSNDPLNHNQQQWIDNNPHSFKRLYGTRNSVGHWQNDRDPEINDPDDERLIQRVEEDLEILRIYVRYALNPYFGLRAY